MLHFKRIFVIMSLVIMSLAAVTLLLTNAPTARATPGIIYVDASAPGPVHDGSSWTTAYLNLQSALDVAVYGDELWVADGVYTPTLGITSTATFALKPGVALYGGFGGYGISETLRTQRNWTIYKSILSGDLDGNDVNTDDNHIAETWNDIQGENAYHVVVASGVTETTVLDGFTITAGSAPTDADGGGMNIESSNPTLANLIFSGNQALHHGGGMASDSSSPALTSVTFSNNQAGSGGGMANHNNSSPMLTDVTFSGNQSDVNGGGLWNGDSNPALTNVVFSNNYAEWNGGGLWNGNSHPTLTNVTFSNNQAAISGGGMGNFFSSSPTLITVTFSSNQAAGGGGMHNTDNSDPTLTDVTFISNTATNNGGGMANDGSSPMLTDITFISNTATSGGGMQNDNGSTPTLTNVAFSNNTATDSGGGMNNWNSNPTLTNVTFSGNWTAGWGGGGMVNDGSSPALTNVTFNNNRAAGCCGGGIANVDSNLTLTNAIFRGNSATNFGGGLFATGGQSTLINVLFSGNKATDVSGNGGGMSNHNGSTSTLTNVTLSGNQAGGSGGGLYNSSGGRSTLVNSIVWGNAAITGSQIFNNASSASIVTYSDVQGGYLGVGNLNVDPNFIAPIAATAAPTTAGNYRLQAASYAIDAGNNLSVTVATDLDGQPRIVDGLVDMGAYEAAARFPEIQIYPPTLAMTLTVNDAGLRYLTISDVGLGRLAWSLAEVPSVGWLSTPLTGTATMSTSQDVAVNFNSAGLSAGTYTTTLRVTSNDSGHAQIDVPVTLVVNTLCDSVAAIDLTRVPADDVFAGDTVRFTASATGTVPFTHTWTVNAVPAGGNRSTLDRAFSAAGAYTVGVTIANACGQQSASLPVAVLARSSNQLDLSASYKTVSLAHVESGDSVTYTLVLRNQSALTATARITDPILAHTAYVVGSARASDGRPVVFGNGQLTWSGQVISGTPVIIEYAVTVQAAPIGTTIINTAQLDDGLGNLVVLEARSTYNPGFSLSIDNGALYTNIPTVSLALTWDAAASIDSMKISNDGGFGVGGSTTVWVPITSTNPGWVLPASGNQRLPYTVYVKFRDVSGLQFGPLQDDIIYDPIVPSTPTVQVIVPSSLHYGAALNTNSVIVRVAATDDNSGVGAIQLSNMPDFAQVTEYAAAGPTTDINWTLPSSGQVYVRVVDRAGNISAEKAAAKYFVYLPLVLR